MTDTSIPGSAASGFVRGAARSRGGKPIIALPSTAKQGCLSRIQATLEAGAGVVTSRGDVHCSDRVWRRGPSR